jgi:hypothetical protein
MLAFCQSVAVFHAIGWATTWRRRLHPHGRHPHVCVYLDVCVRVSVRAEAIVTCAFLHSQCGCAHHRAEHGGKGTLTDEETEAHLLLGKIGLEVCKAVVVKPLPDLSHSPQNN